jgi:hypothetical protein
MVMGHADTHDIRNQLMPFVAAQGFVLRLQLIAQNRNGAFKDDPVGKILVSHGLLGEKQAF